MIDVTVFIVQNKIFFKYNHILVYYHLCMLATLMHLFKDLKNLHFLKMLILQKNGRGNQDRNDRGNIILVH